MGAFELSLISRRDRVGKENLRIFHMLFFVNVQCVRVSASNFQVLTRKSGGARAFGNIVHFLVDPARRVRQVSEQPRSY